MECCDKPEKKGKGIMGGIAYGLIPHIGCIMFIIGSVLGVTILMQFFKPLLMNRYFFYILVLISLVFATFSSYLYLRKNDSLTKEGIKKKKGYLLGMYGSTIAVNLILFMLVFPYISNIGGVVSASDSISLSKIELSVDIPCPGHAPLISNELKTIKGVQGSEFSFPNDFIVYYDSTITSKEEILSLEVFDEYPAEVLSEEATEEYLAGTQILGGCSKCSGCSGACGGACGG
ncbi:MAG: hypothetical protein ABIH72_03960 [archaeon]